MSARMSEKTSLLIFAQAAFADWSKGNGEFRAEIEWTRNALKLDSLTAEQLRAVEYLVHCADHRAAEKVTR